MTAETSALLTQQCQGEEQDQDQDLSLQVLPAWTQLGSAPNWLLAPGIHALAAFSVGSTIWQLCTEWTIQHSLWLRRRF